MTNGSGNIWIKIQNQQGTYQLAKYIRFKIVKGTPTIYGTMGVGESEIGDPLGKIKIAENRSTTKDGSEKREI